MGSRKRTHKECFCLLFSWQRFLISGSVLISEISNSHESAPLEVALLVGWPEVKRVRQQSCSLAEHL
eukprot:2388833-Amphidinium_carterae.1